MKGLHGWSRLWIVVSIVAFGILYGVRAMYFAPLDRAPKLYYEWFNSSWHCDIYFKQLNTPQMIDRPVTCSAKTAEEATERFNRAQAELRSATRAVKADMLDWWIFTGFMWVGLNLLALTVLLVARWVLRGFNQEASGKIK